MAMFTFFGNSVQLPATREPSQAQTRDLSAWQHAHYITIRLVAPIDAIRVHTAGRPYPGRSASAECGAWILIGDVIQTSRELADSRSLPTQDPSSMTAFTHVSEAHLTAETILNLGISSAKFGGRGGEFQAEFVSGPAIRFVPMTGKRWHGSAGNA